MALKIRNDNQLKVKQPLTCMYVVTTHENEGAITEMSDIIKDELNIKNIVFLKDSSSLNMKYIALNFKKAGRVLKEKVQALKMCLDKAAKDEMAVMTEEFQTQQCINVPGWTESLPRDFFVVKTRCKENIAVASDKDTTVALNTALTDGLLLEGLYRELLRQCQLLRKEAGFIVNQRINLGIKSDSEIIKTVIQKYKKSIADETLALKIDGNVDTPDIAKQVDIGGNTVLLELSVYDGELL